MSDYATPYDLAADQYANGDHDTHVGQITGPDGSLHDVNVNPTKDNTVIISGPGGTEREVDVNASKHHPDEVIGDAYLRIATEYLEETR